MSGRKTWCDRHDIARVQYATASRCPRCDAEQQEAYRRAKGHRPRHLMPVKTPEERAQAARDRKARYEAWRKLYVQFTRHMRRHCDHCAEAFR